MKMFAALRKEDRNKMNMARRNSKINLSDFERRMKEDPDFALRHQNDLRVLQLDYH